MNENMPRLPNPGKTQSAYRPPPNPGKKNLNPRMLSVLEIMRGRSYPCTTEVVVHLFHQFWNAEYSYWKCNKMQELIATATIYVFI